MVVAIGNTGCGKSTMLNSLVHGSDKLEEKVLHSSIQITKPNGDVKTKKMKTHVIDMKQEFKDIDHFGVGHSQS